MHFLLAEVKRRGEWIKADYELLSEFYNIRIRPEIYVFERPLFI